MLDLPLRPGGGQAELPFESRGPELESSPPPPPPRPPVRRPGPRLSRQRLALLSIGVVLGMLGAYLIFWPGTTENVTMSGIPVGQMLFRKCATGPSIRAKLTFSAYSFKAFSFA